MTRLVRPFIAAAALALGLSACGSNNNTTASAPPVVVPPPAPAASIESGFGSCFATKFDASPFSKATDPVPCPDLAPLSVTTKPQKI